MMRILTCALIGIVALGPSSAPAAEDPKAVLAELAAEYKALGLPLPPKEAKLVRYKSGRGGTLDGKALPDDYYLMLEIRPAVYFSQTSEWQPAWSFDPKEVEPKLEAMRGVVIDAEHALPLAIQCWHRGWEALATELIKVAIKEQPPTPKTRLTRMAWNHWYLEITSTKSDRLTVARRLKELMARDATLDTPEHRDTLRRLNLTLAPRKGKPGTIEALIDDLVDYNSRHDFGRFCDPGEQYWRLVEKGFDAVPALIAHLDDERLTRGMMMGFNNFRGFHLSVQHVASAVLDGIAGEDLDVAGCDGERMEGSWLRRIQGYSVSPKSAQEWFDHAQKNKEDDYQLARLFTEPKDDFSQPDLRLESLRVLAAKYPERLPAIYRTTLEGKPRHFAKPVVRALIAARIADRDKAAVFREAASHRDFGHRIDGLRALARLEPKAFDELLLKAIQELPADTTEKYAYCPEGRLAELAVSSTEPRIWPAMEKATRRSSLGLRMELLRRLGPITTAREHRLERLRILAGFLDDPELRDENAGDQFGGSWKEFPYTQIEVRNAVAIDIAKFLGETVPVDTDRTPEEWAAIREKVRKAVEAELRKPKAKSAAGGKNF